jgi:hypothetical protein
MLARAILAERTQLRFPCFAGDEPSRAQIYLRA